ncbi:uncharacterized protein PV09_08049 [Verruconis gallopava]|uniref:tetrahydrofolate synthase n=1 Tax=Verruconis gallopava TaxID=253628 RepID=A0A0D1XDM1_9PEZI|nr:uncharacterized protein PV09_08049 [Verruconis gallopava]KIW00336.1 hypothetical protein PV09_08049 [Verruconis gallopava]
MNNRGRKQRIDDIGGTDDEYIDRLEKRIHQLEQQNLYLLQQLHARHVSLSGHVDNEAIASTQQRQDPSIQIRFMDPSKQGVNKKVCNNRSKSFWARIPKTEEQWKKRREETHTLTLPQVVRTFCVLARINFAFTPIEIKSKPSGNDCVAQTLNTYAKHVFDLELRTVNMRQIYNYSMFLFNGLCILALKLGMSEEEVNESAKTFSQARQGKCRAKPQYFEQLRRETLRWIKWGNNLEKKGFRHRAWELLYQNIPSIHDLAKISIAGEVKTCEPPPDEIQALFPFSVPFIIAYMMGKNCSLSQINTAFETNFEKDEYEEKVKILTQMMSTVFNSREVNPLQSTCPSLSSPTLPILHSSVVLVLQDPRATSLRKCSLTGIFFAILASVSQIEIPQHCLLQLTQDQMRWSENGEIVRKQAIHEIPCLGDEDNKLAIQDLLSVGALIRHGGDGDQTVLRAEDALIRVAESVLNEEQLEWWRKLIASFLFHSFPRGSRLARIFSDIVPIYGPLISAVSSFFEPCAELIAVLLVAFPFFSDSFSHQWSQYIHSYLARAEPSYLNFWAARIGALGYSRTDETLYYIQTILQRVKLSPRANAQYGRCLAAITTKNLREYGSADLSILTLWSPVCQDSPSSLEDIARAETTLVRSMAERYQGSISQSTLSALLSIDPSRYNGSIARKLLYEQCDTLISQQSFEAAMVKRREIPTLAGYSAMNILNRLPFKQSKLSAARAISPKERTSLWLDALGISGCLHSTKYIHVAGTKGKGTTCLFTESILRAYADSINRPLKILCTTSPHISNITERIRINSEPVSTACFSMYTQRLWAEMQKHLDTTSHPPLPGYPGFLTLLSFYIIWHEKVDIAVIETGIGGETDSTNVIPRPCAVGVTTLDFDHVEILGNTISSIAWHKSGIFKPGSRAFSVPQQPEAELVLHERSHERACELTIVSEATPKELGVSVYPNMSYQRLNASLAIHLALSVIKLEDPDFTMTKQIAQAVRNAKLIGRNEVLGTAKNIWLINIAHNELSIREASEWLKNTLLQPRHEGAPVVLIFGHHSRRDSRRMLRIIYESLFEDRSRTPAAIVLCTDASGLDDTKPDLIDYRRDLEAENKSMLDHAAFFRDLGFEKLLHAFITVRNAIDFVEGTFQEARVLVLGSVYLVGAARYIILAKEHLNGCTLGSN